MIENKKLGFILIASCIIFGIIIFTFNSALETNISASCACTDSLEGGFCPHKQDTPWQTYLGILMTSLIAALGIYLIFFEKSQKEVINTLEKQRHMQIEDEKFSILMKGLDEEEKKVLSAVKEQDGITQQTLRLRTDLHKSKLSIVLDRLEKKDLISRKEHGKTKQVFIKIAL